MHPRKALFVLALGLLPSLAGDALSAQAKPPDPGPSAPPAGTGAVPDPPKQIQKPGPGPGVGAAWLDLPPTPPSPFDETAETAGKQGPPELPLPAVEELWREGLSWLVPREERDRRNEQPAAEREAELAEWLAAPGGGVSAADLATAVRRRRSAMLAETLTVTDVRARLIFLHGPPQARLNVDCGAVFRPLQLWRYGQQKIVLYEPSPGEPLRMWLPVDGKRALYTREMGLWLEEWAALEGRISGARIDRRLCQASPDVDKVTGVDGLGANLAATPDAQALLALLDPPGDLAAWVKAAAAEPVSTVAALPVEPLAATFPKRQGQRIESRLLVMVPRDAPLRPYEETSAAGVELKEMRIGVEGVIETERALFDSFRMRFALPPAEGTATTPYVVVLPRSLRPGSYIVRLRVRDEVGGAQTVLGGRVEVPAAPQPSQWDSLMSGAAFAAQGDLGRKLDAADDSLVLLVPPRDVVFDAVRAQAVVKGERTKRVTFFLDGVAQLSKSAPPWSVDVKLPRVPREQVLRAEGYDEKGELVASDEVTLNQLQGMLEVSIVQPKPRQRPVGKTLVKAQVVVPEDRKVVSVDISINETNVARLQRPPWEAMVDIPDGSLVYVTVAAELDDGSRAEDVRILSSPDAMGHVDVSLVELYTTVTDSSGELLRGLGVRDFAVEEDGRPQQLEKAELVEDLPLTIGVTLDVSGSMQQALGEAQRAASGFLENMVRPRDRCFAVAFSDRPTLVMPRTSDAGAAAQALMGLKADGWTSLHDAVVFSLYYFQGTRGRRALVLLSDGEDTDSKLTFDESLAYAKESGVVLYTIGLATEALDGSAKKKLARLAEATGGRTFIISRAEELGAVYARIEAELRSQYLLAFSPDRPGDDGKFRRLEVTVARKGAQVRTIPGYVP